MTQIVMRTSQRGAVTLIIALLILVALAIVGIAGTRLVLTQHRISGNSARADAAFAAAEAGVQNAIAYLKANRTVVASAAANGWSNAGSTPKWTACANGATALPCGDGTNNLYPTTWLKYGQLTNQQSLGTGTYTVSTWLLSNTVNATPTSIPYFGCTGLHLATAALNISAGLNAVNTVLAGLPLGQQNFGVPADICLPINFAEEPSAPWPSSINPSITVVSSASDPADTTAGAAASVQQVLAATSLFAGVPLAPLMVNGTANLAGDIRIWGNTRPPTTGAYDFSLLKLNNVLGVIDLTTPLAATVGTLATPIANSINLSFAPVLTGVTPAQALLFNWNVTFPLSIWSSNTTTLGNGVVNKNSSGLLGGSLLSGLLGPVISGLGLNTANLVDLGSNVTLLSSARTCLPQFNGTANSPCTPLSESLLPYTSGCLISVLGICTVPGSPVAGALLPLKLPDVLDPANLLSTVTGLLSSTPTPTFPPDLFNYTYGYPSAQSSNVQQIATAATDCSSVNSGALYWVSGNCALSGTIGSPTAPVTIITTGNVTLAAGTDFYGVIYQRGSGAKTFAGPSSGTRPTVHGAVLSEGNFTGSGSFNVAYDASVVRAAGFRAGGFAPMPGGWNDALTGP